MRDTTKGVILVIGFAVCRAIALQDPSQIALVLSLAAFHEIYYANGGKLTNTNMLYGILWLMVPQAYPLWVLAWEIGLHPWVKSGKIKSKKGKKRSVKHTTTIINEHAANHSIWNIAVEFQLKIVGTTLEPEFIADPKPTDPIMDEITALENISEVNQEASESWAASRYFMAALAFFIMAILGKEVGAAIGVAIAIVIVASKPRMVNETVRPRIDALRVAKTTKLPLSNGVYRLSTRILDFKYHIGIAYVKDGILHTRYHVTHGNAVEINDEAYPTSYTNEAKDIAVYGGTPQITSVSDREELVVALAGPGTNYIVTYKTRAEVDDNGNMVFCGNRSSPGCSGSPVFRLTNVIEHGEDGLEQMVTQYALVGTIGWFYDKKISDGEGNVDERIAVEIVPSEPHTGEYHVRFVPDTITQVFKHPGAGKTRTIAKDLIVDGIAKYGKVYFTGPTRVVCEEAYNALKDIFPDKISLCTSTATGIERGGYHRPIIIAAHATMLNMLAKGAAEVTRKGLWIMDEAHFIDTKTMVLKDLLRHQIKNQSKGALVEMTATGYDIMKGAYQMADGSNIPIRDVYMPEREMTSEIIEAAIEKKVMVFVTAQEGKSETTTAKIAQKAEKNGLPYVILNRETFGKNYNLAKNMKTGIILTTDISECGANLHPDVVFDFQRTSKVTVYGKQAELESRKIDKGQRIQRRGRVGRNPTQSATYVSPGLELPTVDLDRIEHHERKVVADAMGIAILEPTVERSHLNYLNITAAQVSVWASSGENGASSLNLIAMTTDKNGKPIGPSELNHIVEEWASSNEAAIRVDNQVVDCAWWDVRDRRYLLAFLEKLGKYKPARPSNPASIFKMISRMVSGGKSFRQIGAIRDYSNMEERSGNNKTNEEEEDSEYDDPIGVE